MTLRPNFITSLLMQMTQLPRSVNERFAHGCIADLGSQSFLTEFLQTGDTLPLSIHGDQGSSPFPSLSSGLANLVLATSLTGKKLFINVSNADGSWTTQTGLNHPNFITHINVYITLGTLLTSTVSVDFDASISSCRPFCATNQYNPSGV
jgi:hypothetical protein